MAGFRSSLYTLGKALGDLNAITSNKPGAIRKRAERRLLGKIFGRIIGKLVK